MAPIALRRSSSASIASSSLDKHKPASQPHRQQQASLTSTASRVESDITPLQQHPPPPSSKTFDFALKGKGNGSELAVLSSSRVNAAMLAAVPNTSSPSSIPASSQSLNGQFHLPRKPVPQSPSTSTQPTRNQATMPTETSSTIPVNNGYPAVPQEPPSTSYLYARQPRPNSVVSFMSSGTIEVEGFGYENDSDEDDDTYSMFENSLYEGSVYGDGPGENGRRIDRPVTPNTLTRRAERILAGAKKKLDLCGENLSKARESMVVSPGPTAANEARWQSFGGSMSTTTITAMRRDAGHFRTASETVISGPANGVHMERAQSALAGNTSHVNGVPRQELTRSRSTQQMRVLRDQMKDLRGKITNLQQQTRSDSLRRRSMNSLRTSSAQGAVPEEGYSMDSAVWVEDTRETQPSRTLEEVEEVDEQEYETVQEELEDSDGRGTPKPYNPMRESRHEDREDAFSYDSLFLGNGLYATHRDLIERRPMSMDSNSSSGTVTMLLPMKKKLTSSSSVNHSRQNSASRPAALINGTTSPRKRRDSLSSEQSFLTAMEGSSLSSNASSPTDELMEAHHPLRPAPRSWMSPPEFSPRDDGYHSGPNTPKVVEPLSAVTTSHPNNPIHSTASVRKHMHTSSLDPSLAAEQIPRRNSRHLMNGIQFTGSDAGSTHNLLITTSHQPLNGIAGSKEVGLKLVEHDAELVDTLVECLGKMCVSMEMESEVNRREYRRRMERALRILEGKE